MIRIFTDGKTEIPEGVTSTDLGDCTIERISSTHYTAMVTNRSCYICSLISKSKCFLMSSVPVDGNIVEWTIAGPASVTVHKLIASLKEYGYRVKFQHLKAAFDRGYYNVPRRMDLDALCEILGCSKSTLNVALRTAERKLICKYIDGSDKSASRN